jgi:tetratricopeptide (TPR) repeat protein
MEITLLAFVRWVLAVVLLTLASASARADENDDARALFVQGVEDSKQEHWQEAREHFMRSAALVPKPSTLLNLAVVEVRLGLAKDALGTLQRFEQVASPSEHHEMLERARALKQTVQSQLEAKRDKDILPELLDVDGLEGEAAALFEAGRQAHWSGRYEQALQYFQGAHELSQRPELLYDIAAAADRSRKNDQLALESLQQFLAQKPDSPLASAVEARVKVLEQVVEEEQSPEPPAAATQAPTVPKASEKSRHERRALRLIWTGAALEVVAGGTFIYWVDRTIKRNQCGDDGTKCSNTSDIAEQKHLGKVLALSATSLATAVLVSGLGYHAWAKRTARVSVSADRQAAFLSVAAQF